MSVDVSDESSITAEWLESILHLYYSTNGGSTWTQWQGLSLANQPSWTQTTIASNIFDNQSNLMIGWRFVNNNGQAGTLLSLGIDDVS